MNIFQHVQCVMRYNLMPTSDCLISIFATRSPLCEKHGYFVFTSHRQLYGLGKDENKKNCSEVFLHKTNGIPSHFEKGTQLLASREKGAQNEKG